MKLISNNTTTEISEDDMYVLHVAKYVKKLLHICKERMDDINDIKQNSGWMVNSKCTRKFLDIRGNIIMDIGETIFQYHLDAAIETNHQIIAKLKCIIAWFQLTQLDVIYYDEWDEVISIHILK